MTTTQNQFLIKFNEVYEEYVRTVFKADPIEYEVSLNTLILVGSLDKENYIVDCFLNLEKQEIVFTFFNQHLHHEISESFTHDKMIDLLKFLDESEWFNNQLALQEMRTLDKNKEIFSALPTVKTKYEKFLAREYEKEEYVLLPKILPISYSDEYFNESGEYEFSLQASFDLFNQEFIYEIFNEFVDVTSIETYSYNELLSDLNNSSEEFTSPLNNQIDLENLAELIVLYRKNDTANLTQKISEFTNQSNKEVTFSFK